MRFVHTGIKKLASTRAQKIADSFFSAEKDQKSLLEKIIKDRDHTLFSKEYGLFRTTSYEVFTKIIPVFTYESFYPYIEQVLKNEKNVLTNGRVSHFAKSSGTTNARSKYIPLPKKNLLNNHYKVGKDICAWVIDRFTDESFYLGKTISITGSMVRIPEYISAHVGDISAHLVSFLPWWAKRSRATKLSTALLPEWTTKSASIVQESLLKDVRILAGAPTWILEIFDRALEKTGKKTVREIWPHVQVFFHGAVDFKPYKKLFEQKLGDSSITYVNVYNASEGAFGFQYKKDISDEFVLLTNHDVFYEFISMTDFRNDNMDAIPLWEIEVSKEYALVITTSGGLTRYVIGDTLMFISKNPYLFKLTGRIKQSLNTFGEEVVVGNIEHALAEVLLRFPVTLRHFTIAPEYMKDKQAGCHHWVIEFEQAPEDIDVFRKEIDAQLRACNSDYDAKRKGDIVLGLPKITIVPRGTFDKWFKEMKKEGGQHKVPLLSDDRTYIEKILKYKDL